MLKKIWQNNLLLSFLAGLFLVFSFAPFNFALLCFGFPWLFGVLLLRAKSPREAALFGFVASLAIMLCSFYWVVYVLHEFGYLPWIVATLLYMLFCGLGALNLPLYMGVAFWLLRKGKVSGLSPAYRAAVFTIGLPALFTVIEWLIPKLFPWYAGHMFYRSAWVNQIVELTGCSYLTFILFSAGGVLALLTTDWKHRHKMKVSFAVCGGLWLFALGFSFFRAIHPWPVDRSIKVALVQANIGSLEKVAARKGIEAKVRYTVDRYLALTEQALREGPKPDLIVWPETAMPFTLEGSSRYAREIKETIRRWEIAVITGGYVSSHEGPDRDYNAAYLLEPEPDGALTMDIYRKNILLAFGEYMPLADLYPPLYDYFPQVSNFARGETQNPFKLRNGTLVGMTVCYEAIVPEFFRLVASHHVQLVVNLTNDSWFGPTAEPLQHGALAVFRAIEMRIPLVRVTNTGTSFTVDSQGQMSAMTPVYGEGILHSELSISSVAPETLYLRWGDWVVLLSALVVAAFIYRGRRVSLSH